MAGIDVGGTSYSYSRITVIANPAAGSTSPGLVSAAVDEMRAYAQHVDVLWAQAPGQAAKLAHRCAAASPEGGRRPDMVVAIGGDGTLREVAAGLIEAGAPPSLLLLPGGTGNSNYRSLWDDMPWRDALVAGLTGAGAQERYIDLAQIADLPRLVVLGASTGLFAEATASAATIPVAGRTRYLAAITEVARSYAPYPGQVVVDGAVVQEGPTVLVNVGGSRHRAGVLEVLPHSLRDDGLLDVCVIGAPVAAAEVTDLLLHGAHLGRPGVVYARGESVTVRRLDGCALGFESDGEVVDSDLADFTITVLPGVLRVLSSSLRPGG